MKRRQFIQGVSGLAGLSALAGLYTWQIEPFWLEFVKKKMPIRNLPNDLVGKTLMQVSDIHVGNRFDWQFLIDSFQKAQKLNPDFVVYTGDYVSYENEQQVDQLQKVLKHALTGTIGTFGVLGNHDYGDFWAEDNVADAITDVLQQAGITVLRNEQRIVDGLNFIGLDDFWGTNFQPDRVMAKHDQQQASVVLCHNPDVCDLDIWNGYQGWILSGHTHGGQCKPPFLPPPMLPVKNREYTAGEIDLNDGRTLYINRALGHLWQVRFNVRPEITVFELSKT
ncbi:metallophosphoesterase [Tunicatimonas pelagia]|uniref:metallophosphoesterase n=1 Tax=Tunicatimonas pelagia TaxID=931531 RepID=UPI002665EA56|nr:metallophosphoesterase [Tunicatimonas pelagia]WKN40832.1 metallophosphoesterase [Tunicatimonas pelagia]